MTELSIEALLFDLGGVVIEIDFERAIARWSELSGAAPQRLRKKFSFDADYERHERGEIGSNAYFDSLRQSLGLSLTDSDMLSGWNTIFMSEVAGIDDLLARFAGRTALFAFTNSNLAHQQVWENRFSGVLSHFRTVFTSSVLGARKPEAAAFAAVSDAMQVAPAKTLFFDDSPANVKGAKAIGMNAVLVRSMHDVANALGKVGL